jgi:hypothetical protein
VLHNKLEHPIAYAVLGLVGGVAFPTWRTTLWMLALLPLLAIALAKSLRLAARPRSPTRSPAGPAHG